MKPPHIVVLGIGNVLWAAEGFGVRITIGRFAAAGRWAIVETPEGGGT